MARTILTTVLTALLIGVVCPAPGSAAVQQFDTDYFTIIYDENGAYTAGQIATFCDEIYEDLMGAYDAFTGDPRVTCIVNDAVDLANGYAVYYENTITVYATNADFELRGQADWLRNVFVHEMTHMIALKRAARGPVNAVVLNGAQYNENPDFDVTLLWYHFSQPAWFSEGSAQVGAERFGSDSWDTHRDMLLRTMWFEDRLLGLGEMGTLTGTTSLGAEQVYNQGYSLVSYIRGVYGDAALRELNNRSAWFDFDGAISDVLGIGADDLYDDWKIWLDRRYASFRGRMFVTGDKVIDEGTFDLHPAVSPDGRHVAWLSSRNRDIALTDLMLTDLATGSTRVLVEEVDGRVSWSHDSSAVVYVRRPEGSPEFYDIYTCDIVSGAETRRSKNLRAVDPSFSPNDSLIVFVRHSGGNTGLALMNADGSGVRNLTATHDGTQFFAPSFSPDGRRIVFGIYRQGLDRDIAVLDADIPSWRHEWELADTSSAFADSLSFPEGSGFTIIAGSTADERDPAWLPDGGIVCASDRTGVFNLYRLDPADGRSVRLTDVPGGTFQPGAAPDGTVYYTGFAADGFSIYHTDANAALETVEPEPVQRDYAVQPEPFDLGDRFDVGPYRLKRVVNGIVPTLMVGPSFIGSRFGLNVVDLGARVAISDVLGYDAIEVGGSLGRNLREDVGLNSSVDIRYERSLLPVTSSGYDHAPIFFAEASRTVVNNLIGRFDARIDTVYYADVPEYGYTDVLHDIHQRYIVDDGYRDEFRRYRAGIEIPLSRRQRLTVEAGFRRYFESLERYERLDDASTLTVGSVDITGQFEGTRTTTEMSTRYFTTMQYFASRELGLIYNYVKSDPSADAVIAPKGTAIQVSYRHLRATVADSLVDQPQYLAPVGVYPDGSIAVSAYTPDPLLDQLRPFQVGRDINEYLVAARKNMELPWWRHTLDGFALMGYRDLRLQDARAGEGSGYNWPLKFYLGGANLLSGYPYFAFWGTKIAYGSLGYTFPLAPKIGRSLFGVTFLRFYASVFGEAGRVWNFRHLSMDTLKQGEFKRDAGVELRATMAVFYRFPLLAYARVAWPLDDMGGSPYENDARRFYFGVRM